MAGGRGMRAAAIVAALALTASAMAAVPVATPVTAAVTGGGAPDTARDTARDTEEDATGNRGDSTGGNMVAAAPSPAERSGAGLAAAVTVAPPPVASLPVASPPVAPPPVVPPAALSPAPVSAPVSTTPPRRVVSVNLCTDQIAMALAAPGQLVSVSHLAREPQSSAMVAEAQHYPVNYGGAEEIYLLAPDLVLAGGYGGASVALLHRLGVKVVEVPPPDSLADARAAITQVGAALGREAEAAAMLADFDARLAALARPAGADAPLAATWGPNGYSSGGATLAGDVLRAAGFSLLADRLGLQGAGYIPLEALVMADPALIVTATPYPGASRAEEVVTHPALSSLSGRVVHVPDALWTCPTPRLLDALALLSAEARLIPGTAP